MFRREVGVPMREWLTRVRLDHAAALIREGVKVEAVSLLVGYRSKKNFYRQFKRRFGTTPFAYGIAARIEANAAGTARPVSAETTSSLRQPSARGQQFRVGDDQVHIESGCASG
jgi:AraC-like DNA-binding protein